MKLSTKKCIQKIITLILILITLFSSLPINQIFAWTSGEGQKATSAVGEPYVGLDEKEYYFTKGTDGIQYDENGNIKEVIIYRDRPLEKFYLVRNGEKVNAFCIEAVTKFEDGQYSSTNYNNSSYFNNLPYTAQYGIMLATVYGWRKDLPTELKGLCNMDDYLYAVQLIIWEYQQQIRTSPTKISPKHDIPADVYSHSIKNRPAEIAYNWILNKMANHTTIPSFASSTSNSAKTHTLKYNSSANNFSLTITDTNNTLADLKFIESSSGVSVTRKGNQYTFTSKNMIKEPIAVVAQKDINQSTDSMLVWGRGGYQTMATGVNDPVRFYIKLKTEDYGKLHLIKKSEDGVTEGINFRIKGNGIDKTVTTKKDGTIDVDNLLPGVYEISEEKYDRYVAQDTQTVTIRSGQTSTVTFNNVLKKFRVTVTKSDKETGTPQGNTTLKGANYGMFKGNQLIDKYITNENGEFTTKYYVCGDDWTIRELDSSEGYLLDETVHQVGAEPGLFTVEYNSIKKDVDEQVKKGKISIIKHSNDGSTQIETPEKGAMFEVYLETAGSYANAKETERDILTCDEDGFAETKLLPYGVYVVHQTYGWDNRELVQDFKVHILENGKTYRYLINNKEFESYLKMEKVDKKTGKKVTFSNASFKLSKLNENLREWEKVHCKVGNEHRDTWTTNSEGIAYTETKLKSGTYKLEEIKTPERIFAIK